MLTLLLLMLATRTQLGLSPGLAAASSIVLAAGLAWVVDRYVPPDEDEEQEDAAAEVQAVDDGAGDR
jgi:hypothetical protein